MTSFILNPRKALRFPLQCGTVVHAAAGPVTCRTENVSASGCQLVSAAPLGVGERLWVRLARPGAGAALALGATVVWASQAAPGRSGVRFDQAGQALAERWLDGIAADHLELLDHERVPDRLGLTARLFVSPAPESLPSLGDEEVAVLRLACRQPTVGDLRHRLGPDWSRAQRALFALLTRGVITLDAAEAGDPRGWRRLLEEPSGGAVRGRAVVEPR